MRKTIDNLEEAFANESQANQRYRAFAKKAERDGFPNVAKLFCTTAEAKRIHAEGHLPAIDDVTRGVDLDLTDFFLCTLGGHIELGTPAVGWPTCSANAKAFTRVDPML